MSDEEVSDLEKNYIAEFDTTDPRKGYNIGEGGEGVTLRHLNQERKEKLKKQMCELGHKNKNKVVSDETREKQRQAKLGKKRGPMSQETKDKISKANSVEMLSKESRKRRKLSKQKKVVAINNADGSKILFESGEDAAKYFGVRSSSISRWISGDRKPTNDYKFRFATNND